MLIVPYTDLSARNVTFQTRCELVNDEHRKRRLDREYLSLTGT